MSDHTFRIENGVVKFVYADEVADLCDEGTVEVCRVSHVEPYDGSGGFPEGHEYYQGAWWTADMGPVDGPVLGPFKTRAEALAAERAWLTAEQGL